MCPPSDCLAYGCPGYEFTNAKVRPPSGRELLSVPHVLVPHHCSPASPAIALVLKVGQSFAGCPGLDQLATAEPGAVFTVTFTALGLGFPALSSASVQRQLVVVPSCPDGQAMCAGQCVPASLSCDEAALLLGGAAAAAAVPRTPPNVTVQVVAALPGLTALGMVAQGLQQQLQASMGRRRLLLASHTAPAFTTQQGVRRGLLQQPAPPPPAPPPPAPPLSSAVLLSPLYSLLWQRGVLLDQPTRWLYVPYDPGQVLPLSITPCQTASQINGSGSGGARCGVSALDGLGRDVSGAIVSADVSSEGANGGFVCATDMADDGQCVPGVYAIK